MVNSSSLNRFISLKRRINKQKLIPLTKIAEITAKVCASAGAIGIGLKLYVSFSWAFITNKIVVLPINPNIWDAVFLIISGATLTTLQLKETIQWRPKVSTASR